MISDLSKKLNEAIKEEQLISLLQIKEELREELIKKNPHFPTENEVLVLANSMHVNPNHLYYVNKEMGTYCYYNFPTYFSIDVMNEQFIQTLQVSERIKALKEVTKESLEQKDYSKLFFLTEVNAKVLIFNRLYWIVPDEIKYILYRELYTLIDYGHGAITEEIKRDVWKHQPSKDKLKCRRKLDKLIDGETITVYRGEGSSSTTHDKAMSWTTSLTVAAFFATRIRSDLEAKVYKAIIRKEHILDYFNGRNEDEVILFPENLMEIECLPMYTLKDGLEPLQVEGYMDEYFLYKNTYINERDYRHPKGIHGLSHVKRVLFHAMELSRALGLSDSDRAILANASVYHDIGRTHDGYCTMHGEWSWKQYVDTIKDKKLLVSINCVKQRKEGLNDYVITELNKEDVAIVQFLIEYHCRNDQEGMHALRKRKLSDKTRERYWRLFLIFKDCDGLDRVRLPIDELDVKYFRTEQAKERLVFAYQVKNITQQL